ncbi:hypothetical protein Tco_0420414 [Tanacetum coccineum]
METKTTTDPASPSVSAPKTSTSAHARKTMRKPLKYMLSSAYLIRHLLSFHDAVPTAPNYASHSDEIICSFFSQQASMPTTHGDEDLLQIDEDAMEEIDIRDCKLKKMIGAMEVRSRTMCSFVQDWTCDLTGAIKMMIHQFGIESSNSMESDISSGDETLTDSAYENFKREKAYKAVPPPTVDDEETDVSEKSKELLLTQRIVKHLLKTAQCLFTDKRMLIYHKVQVCADEDLWQRQQMMKLFYGTEDWEHCKSQDNNKMVQAISLMAIPKEGLLLGNNSTSSKGFRVYNRVTRKVQECLHVNFLENQENQKGKGPDWMFDLDLLTPSMNYIPVRKENYADSEKQKSLAKAHNDDQRIAFLKGKEEYLLQRGKEHDDSTFTSKRQEGVIELNGFLEIKRDERGTIIKKQSTALVAQDVFQECMSYMATSRKKLYVKQLQVLIGLSHVLTASRPDIMFACLSDVQDFITPKDLSFSPLECFFPLVTMLGDNHDRRSTSRGCQYLEEDWSPWQCKKPTIWLSPLQEAEKCIALQVVVLRVAAKKNLISEATIRATYSLMIETRELIACPKQVVLGLAQRYWAYEVPKSTHREQFGELFLFKTFLHPPTGKLERKANICYTRYLSLIMEHMLKDAYKNENLMSLKPHNITATTFKPTLNNEITLTAYMYKVAALSPDPIKYLLPLSREVNVDDTADKPRKKKIQSSTQPKALESIRESSLTTQVAETQPAKETVVIVDATKSLDGFKSAEEQVNQPKTTEVEKEEVKESGLESIGDVTFDQIMDEIDQKNKAAQEKPESQYDTESEIKIIKRFQPRKLDDDAQIMFLGVEPSHFEYDQTKSTMHGGSDSDSGLHSMPDDDLVSLTDFETPDSADNDSQGGTDKTFHASTDMPPFGHLHEELRTLNTKVDQLESNMSKKVTDDIQSFVPSIVIDTLKETLPGLLLEALKDTLPQMIKDAIQQSIQESIKEKLTVFDAQVKQTLQSQLPSILKPINKQFNAFNTLESHKFVTLQHELSKVIKTKLADLRIMYKDMVLLLEAAKVFKKANAKGEKGATISSRIIKCRTSPPVNEENALVLHALVEKSSEENTSEKNTTSSIFLPTPLRELTPPRDPTPPRDESKGKGIVTKELLNEIMPCMEVSGSAPNIQSLKSFVILEGQLTNKDVLAQVKEMKRLADLKPKKEKSKKSLQKILNLATIKAQA